MAYNGKQPTQAEIEYFGSYGDAYDNVNDPRYKGIRTQGGQTTANYDTTAATRPSQLPKYVGDTDIVAYKQSKEEYQEIGTTPHNNTTYPITRDEDGNVFVGVPTKDDDAELIRPISQNVPVDTEISPATQQAETNTSAVTGPQSPDDTTVGGQVITETGDGFDEFVDFENFENFELDDAGNLIPLPIINRFNTEVQPAVADDDWRVRLSLAPSNRRLYQADEPGILYPLKATRGIIFPYTPTINVQHMANYENYDLTHSNYRGYFYKGSVVHNLLITATFTAQDTAEANYMLASLHFLRSCTKMFYGQDAERGTPPPVVFLHGFGEYGFDNHPCAVTTMNFNLPNDVDYIAAGVPDNADPASDFQETKAPYTGHQSWSSKISRMLGAQLTAGAERGPTQTAASQTNQNTNEIKALTKIYEGKTYVPTKIDINFTMIPIQTRQQVSKEFSLKDYASGKLIKKGFW